MGECIDRGPIDREDFTKDIENLRRVADALPRKCFKTFALLTKLSPFTPEEIKLALTLQDEYRQRAILLTAREIGAVPHLRTDENRIRGIECACKLPRGVSRATSLHLP